MFSTIQSLYVNKISQLSTEICLTLISEELFINLIKSEEDFNAFLTQGPMNDFRDSPQEGYFLSIGFLFAQINLNLKLNNPNEIINFYLS